MHAFTFVAMWPRDQFIGSRWCLVMNGAQELKHPFFLTSLPTRSKNKWSYIWKWSLDEVYRLQSVWRVSCQQELLLYCHPLVFQPLEKYLGYTTGSGKAREICSHLSAQQQERLLRLWGQRLLRSFMKFLSEPARLTSNFEVTDFPRIYRILQSYLTRLSTDVPAPRRGELLRQIRETLASKAWI